MPGLSGAGPGDGKPGPGPCSRGLLFPELLGAKMTKFI